MLIGTMEVLDDKKTKKEIWKDEYEMYYKGGRDAENGRYYSNFRSEDFGVE